MKSRNDITHRSLEPEDRDRPLSVATRFKRDWNISERDLPVSSPLPSLSPGRHEYASLTSELSIGFAG